MRRLSGTCASSGRATMGARVPSKSKASRGWPAITVSMACCPSRENKCFMVGSRGGLVLLQTGFDALSQAPATGVGEHAPSPAVNVGFTDGHAQAGHALALLGLGHAQGSVQGLGCLFNVVRVHDERFLQFAGRPGEAAEDQHAAFVVAR